MTRQVATMTLNGVYKVIYDDTKDEYRVIQKINGKQKTINKFRLMASAIGYLYKLAIVADTYQ